MTDYVYTSGGFPSSPTSGDSLVINGAYYDWTGGAWKIRNATPLRSEFIATANQATKTGLTYFVGSIDCYINGAKMLLGTDFTATNGTSVTFTPALDLDDEVQLIMGVSASSVPTAATGTTLPSPVPAVGTMFFKTDTSVLYISYGGAWVGVTEAEPMFAAWITSGGTAVTPTAGTMMTLSTPGYYYVDLSGGYSTVTLAVAGASGGNNIGGKGGKVSAVLNTSSGVTALLLVVGGQGSFVTSNIATGGANGGYTVLGGFNGGGNGVTNQTSTSRTDDAGGGGGASDIRTVFGTSITDFSGATRIMVGGGGGGGTGNGNIGGYGGHTSGQDGGQYSVFQATGGSQTAGGNSVGGSTGGSGGSGALGVGGSYYNNTGWNGGGGGGYYGGGAHQSTGGGGGSSYASSAVTSVVYTNDSNSASDGYIQITVST